MPSRLPSLLILFALITVAHFPRQTACAELDGTSRLVRRTWYTGQNDEEEDADMPASAVELPKYFQEPPQSSRDHHYDLRYFRKTMSFGDRRNALISLVKSYLQFFNEQGIETWLAHGTLLGWWWNARTLPWDTDVDMQTSIATLQYMARHHNYTRYTFTVPPDVDEASSSSSKKPEELVYLLDINPDIGQRKRGGGNNIIDARWIDISNGLYIDVTAVAETHPVESPGVWACKNYHRYRTRDLWPMRETLYEGMLAKVPYAYERIIAEEYGERSLVVDIYKGWKWSKLDQIWFKMTGSEQKAEAAKNNWAARRKQKQDERAALLHQQEKELDRYRHEELPAAAMPQPGEVLQAKQAREVPVKVEARDLLDP